MSTDVFPRRNLPDEAEPWGRDVESRIRGVEDRATGLETDSGSLNRASTAGLTELALQVAELDRLRQSIPRSAASTTTRTNFALASGWATIATALISMPGAVSGQVTAASSGVLISSASATQITVQFRLLLNGGDPSPVYSGAAYAGGNGFYVPVIPSSAWAFPGSSARVDLQVLPANASSYPAGTGSHVALTLFGSFNG